MPDIQAQSADGMIHSFPDGTKPEVIDKVMKEYATSVRPSEAQQAVSAPAIPGAGQPATPGGTQPPVQVNPTHLLLGGEEKRGTPEQEAYLKKTLPLVPQRVADLRKEALAIGGAAFGGSAVSGTGLLPAVLRMAGAGSGAATGNVAGSAISGQMPNPKEALQVGGAAAVGQGMGEVASPAAKWMTASKSVGKKMLEQASAKVGNAPVELSPRTNELVDSLVQESKSGGQPVKVISDLLDRLGPSTRQAADATPGPLTYDEARRFYKNSTGLTVDEVKTLKPVTKWLFKQFVDSFGQDIQQTATAGGAGTEHAIGMEQFATSSARNRALAKGAKIAGIGGTAALGDWAIRKGIGAMKP